jgi:hypothetical protein
MRKSDKKIDNRIRLSLTEVCEHALTHIQGFQWLTHHADYQRFPESLRVICVFDTNESLTEAYSRGDDEKLRHRIREQLQAIKVRVSDIECAVSFVSEESGNVRNLSMGKSALH